jgi:cytochrome c-type biogenesis protein CcmH/NrfG
MWAGAWTFDYGRTAMTPDRKRIVVPLAIAAVAVTVTAGALYTQLARRAAPGPSPSEAVVAAPSAVAGAPPGAATRPAPAIEVAAGRLEQRLKDKDGSADDWALLARSYVQMQRYPQAVDAFGRALEKSPGNAAFLAEQAAARKAGTEGGAPR